MNMSYQRLSSSIIENTSLVFTETETEIFWASFILCLTSMATLSLYFAFCEGVSDVKFLECFQLLPVTVSPPRLIVVKKWHDIKCFFDLDIFAPFFH